MAHVEDTIAGIERRLEAGWTTTPIHYYTSNMPFIERDVPYIALNIEEGAARQVSFGNGVQMHRYDGIIIIQIFVKERTGARLATQYASTLSDLFRSAQFEYLLSGMITCRTPEPRIVGVQAGWFQLNVEVEYKRDKIH